MKHNPVNYGAVGAGNDTAAIQAAINAIRTDGYGELVLDGAITGGGSQQAYDVASLDVTNCKRITVAFDAGIILRGSLMTPTTQGAILDFTGTHEVRVHGNAAIYGGLGDPWSPLPPTTPPLAGILIAGDTDKTVIDSMNITGWFKSGCVAVVSAVSIEFRSCQLINRYGSDPAFGGGAPPALMITSNPGEWLITSLFTTIPHITGASADLNFFGGEIHAINGPGGGWTVYCRNAYHCSFWGTTIDSNRTGHFLFQGANDHINLYGVKPYTEVPPVPVHVFDGTSGTANVRSYGPGSNFAAACSGSMVFGGVSLTQY